jgi:hypothetical protein
MNQAGYREEPRIEALQFAAIWLQNMIHMGLDLLEIRTRLQAVYGNIEKHSRPDLVAAASSLKTLENELRRHHSNGKCSR